MAETGTYQVTTLATIDAAIGAFHPERLDDPLVRLAVPSVELATYAIDVRALTGGRGRLTIQHDHYDVVPDHIAGKLLESRAKSGAQVDCTTPSRRSTNRSECWSM